MTEETTPIAEPTLDTDRLVTVLSSLETEIKKQTSLKFTLIKGMVYGVGTVVGASVLVALFGGIIAATVSGLTGANIDPTSFSGN